MSGLGKACSTDCHKDDVLVSVMLNPFFLRAAYSRRLTLLSYTGLIVLFSLSTLVWPSCNRDPNVPVWLLHVLPILAFLPGILKQNLRAHIWLCFILLGYFLASVSTAFSCTSILMILEVVVLVILFISAMLYVRWHAKALKYLEAGPAEKDNQVK